MKCDQCGLCCMMFDRVELPEEYKLLNDGTGKCKYLKNNLCSIYKDRPPLCNSEWMYEHCYKEQYSPEAFEEFMSEKCSTIKKLFQQN